MKVLAGKVIRGLWTYRLPFMKLGGVFFLIIIVLNVVYYFVSVYSPGCLVCHYMKPYYEQDHTSHKDVACVTCHPNRRILTAPYLLRYIAGAYNPRPRAEVDDDICLKCHEAQNLKKSTAFEMNISFSHAGHLGDLKRGKKLRCTSCHARGEKEHFVINKNVCFTCHFKGSERGHSATSCNTCHGIPRKTVEHSGFKFSHESYIKIGVDCSQCHLDVTKGNAEVEKKVCYKCHVERTEEFGNIDKIHNIHVTTQGVDCEECHNSITHGKVKMISLLEANCENCHSLKHSLQRELYIGSEGRGVTSIPSRMFAAQVSCEGCHLDLNHDGKSDMNERRQACVKCHSAGYDQMLDKWISLVDESVNRISASFGSVNGMISSAKNSGKDVTAEKNYLEDAQANFDLVKEGKGAHNVDYAISLLKNVADNLEGIAQRLGNSGFKVDRGKLLTDDREYCNMCHSSIESPKVEKFGDVSFPHDTHKKFIVCTKCHSRDEHKKITVKKEDCDNCHKNFSTIPDRIKFGSISFPHNLHSKQHNMDCLVCHANTDFSKVVIKKDACTNCHHKDKELRKNCANCHSLQNSMYNGSVSGGKFDPDIMNSAGVKCEDCHTPNKTSVTRPSEKVCVDCHDASYRNTQLDWMKEIKSKTSQLSSLVKTAQNSAATEDEKNKLSFAKKLISAIQSDGSKGIHNYMVLSSLLDSSLKDLKKITGNK